MDAYVFRRGNPEAALRWAVDVAIRRCRRGFGCALSVWAKEDSAVVVGRTQLPKTEGWVRVVTVKPRR